MSRSGYYEYDGDDQWAMIRYRGAINSAIHGKRGQMLLRELAAALDAMQDKRLIAGELVDANGEACALGVVGVARGLNMSGIDVEDYEAVAKAFNIAESLAREIEFVNDDDFSYGRTQTTPEQRWKEMRKWVAGNIVEAKP